MRENKTVALTPNLLMLLFPSGECELVSVLTFSCAFYILVVLNGQPFHLFRLNGRESSGALKHRIQTTL